MQSSLKLVEYIGTESTRLAEQIVVRQFYLLQIPVIVVQDLARSHYRTCGARNKPRSGMSDAITPISVRRYN